MDKTYANKLLDLYLTVLLYFLEAVKLMVLLTIFDESLRRI
jgi:hypothetical protein